MHHPIPTNIPPTNFKGSALKDSSFKPQPSFHQPSTNPHAHSHSADKKHIFTHTNQPTEPLLPNQYLILFTTNTTPIQHNTTVHSEIFPTKPVSKSTSKSISKQSLNQIYQRNFPRANIITEQTETNTLPFTSQTIATIKVKTIRITEESRRTTIHPIHNISINQYLTQ